MGTGALQRDCHLVGTSVLLSWHLYTLAFISACEISWLLPHTPLGPCTFKCNFFFFLLCKELLKLSVKAARVCTAASQHVWRWLLRGWMGRRWLVQLHAGKMMAHLDRRNAETMFMAAVVMPNSGASPCPLGIKAPFCKASAFTNGSFWPGRVFCAGCPLTEISVFPI